MQKDRVNGPEGNNLFYELAERALDGPVSEKIKEYISEVCEFLCLVLVLFSSIKKFWLKDFLLADWEARGDLCG